MSDITRDIDEARAELARWSDADPTYAELMATYVALGTLLDLPDRDPAAWVDECRTLARRTIALAGQQQREWDERWAAWCARHMTSGGGRGQ